MYELVVVGQDGVRYSFTLFLCRNGVSYIFRFGSVCGFI